MDIDILSRVQNISDQIISWRRHIHENPELSFEEYKTSEFVYQRLNHIEGMKVEKGVGVETSVIGILSNGEGPTVAIRADMDALPIMEETTHSFPSKNQGVMHACGHDAHTAIGLSVATIMGEIWKEGKIKGTVKFIFQPAEEDTDAFGKTGSPYLIEAGVLRDVDCIIALHMNPGHEVGTVLIHDGYSMSNVDVFQATIHGTGGHGAYPHLATDPIWMLGPVLQAIHGIVARNISPLDAAVISVGEVKGGSASNIIPTEVFLQGTLRSYQPSVREELGQRLEKAFSIVEAFGGKYELDITRGEPALFNNAEVNKVLKEVVAELYPTMTIKEIPFGLAGEDFSHMAYKVPGSMIFLGCAYPDGVKRDLHTPIFDIDERCLPIGASILIQTLLKYLLGDVPLPKKVLKGENVAI
ncbi:M20 metallopeptidase family protein [Rummeliibacillus suwonensis]|jgi:amidohydrolase|uniref:M20 metallopeptidase family protein n=1 Tax=Rummeliibacillus suwonensis TaxID=1306154 RepID=UPI0011B7F398|nr:amidohydrolase [Rummeliibacillus suwonensis]MBO2536851.1 amidohydrolase [Rummeliibacillus suwonensis]